MSPSEKQIPAAVDRRGFLKTGVATAVGTAAARSASWPRSSPGWPWPARSRWRRRSRRSIGCRAMRSTAATVEDGDAVKPKGFHRFDEVRACFERLLETSVADAAAVESGYRHQTERRAGQGRVAPDRVGVRVGVDRSHGARTRGPRASPFRSGRRRRRGPWRLAASRGRGGRAPRPRGRTPLGCRGGRRREHA